MTNIFYHAGKVLFGIWFLVFGIGVVAGISFMENPRTMMIFAVLAHLIGLHWVIFAGRHAEACRLNAERMAKFKWLGWMHPRETRSYLYQYVIALIGGIAFALFGIFLFLIALKRY